MWYKFSYSELQTQNRSDDSHLQWEIVIHISLYFQTDLFEKLHKKCSKKKLCNDLHPKHHNSQQACLLPSRIKQNLISKKREFPCLFDFSAPNFFHTLTKQRSCIRRIVPCSIFSLFCFALFCSYRHHLQPTQKI